jgi:hypothetical protein
LSEFLKTFREAGGVLKISKVIKTLNSIKGKGTIEVSSITKLLYSLKKNNNLVIESTKFNNATEMAKIKFNSLIEEL